MIIFSWKILFKRKKYERNVLSMKNKVIQKNQKGVTLVALVITIIVIIILSTVTIDLAFGNNGLIKRAQLAKDMAANSTTAEQEEMNRVMEEFTNIMEEDNEITVPDEPEWDTSKVTPVESADGVTVPVPIGYTASEATGENSVNDGFVIYEGTGVVNDGNVSTAKTSRNQFVWIPVEDESLFKRYDGYWNGELQEGFVDMCSEPYAGGYTNEAQEFNEMKARVTANNGFYVGRYEAGTTLDFVFLNTKLSLMLFHL